MHFYLPKQVKTQRHPSQCTALAYNNRCPKIVQPSPKNPQLICTEHRCNSLGWVDGFLTPSGPKPAEFCACAHSWDQELPPKPFPALSVTISDVRKHLFHNYALKLMQFLIL